MNTVKERLCFSERIKIILKALRVSIKTKSKVSILISLVGFLMAFVPVISSNVLKQFTNEIQEISINHSKSISDVFATFTVLTSLFIIQTIFNFLFNYIQEVDRIRTDKYIHETVLRCTCDVKYIENYDDFKEKIYFVNTYAGYKVAESMQMIIIWIQNMITFISIFYVLVNVNIWIVIILLVTCIPSVILSYRQKYETYRQDIKWMKEGAMVIHYFFICVAERTMLEI
ncbi:hypothetical protein KQI89_02280 [Clostridium sp. MSJ-4]|uniref:ABC transmembrane type-1 domain-containing protein n=1 Tax=Clostridium simiarum TaxID=2841506 RepID=A0ABS6EWH8_9CLOT|nr:hypothetical protein [Clostridium simiarum]MBU5590582.1 hypothetical protein [Clostridium simiarum]